MASNKSSARSKPSTGAGKSGGRSRTARPTSARNAGPASNRSAKSRPRSTGRGGAALSSKAFKRAKTSAAKILKDPEAAKELEQKALKKGTSHKADLGAAFDDMKCLIRLIQAYTKGTYRDLPAATIVAAAAALVYFVNPFDLIPDPIPAAGYIDDTAVLLFVVAAISVDLDNFRTWEQGQAASTRTRAKTRSRSTPAAATPAPKAARRKRPEVKPATKGSRRTAASRPAVARSARKPATTGSP
jgi:uncharacterized membrane protein YkvA (DUF1232 family)